MMAAPLLDAGAIEAVVTETVNAGTCQPVLQIVDFRRITSKTGTATDRYRVVLSDGTLLISTQYHNVELGDGLREVPVCVTLTGDRGTCIRQSFGLKKVLTRGPITQSKKV